MKILTFILLSLSLVSCGRVNQITQSITGKPVSVCHNGISYIQFVSGVSVEYETKTFIEGTEELVQPTVKKCK